MNEVHQLLTIPLKDDLRKRIVLLGILTDLVFRDIRYLTWNQFGVKEDSYYLQFRQRKPYKPQHVSKN
jgi:hypothetical protein